MRANHQPSCAALNQGQHLAPLLGFLAAGKPCGLHTQRLQPADQFGEVLLGQDFSRRHQGTLPARVDTKRRRQRCHHGFAGTDIALQ